MNPLPPVVRPLPMEYGPPVTGNVVPGDYSTYNFGGQVFHLLHKWCEVMGKGDYEGARVPGEALMRYASEVGNADAIGIRELLRVMQSVMDAVKAKPSAMGAIPGIPGMPTGQDQGSDEGLSWHEPNPNMFYALDDKSGARLAKVLDDIQNAHRYIVRGAPAPTRQLFIGKPGNGKTTGVFWLGGKLGLPVALIRLDGVASSLVGKKEKNLRACIESAMKRKCIIALDEFESVAVPRSNQGPNVGQWSRDCTGALLQLIDSLPPEQAFIGCTNHPEAIDAAVLERMRDYVVFHPPNRETRAYMIGAWWSQTTHDGAAKRVLLDKTDGWSGRRLQAVAHAANRAAGRRGDGREDISVTDVEEAVRDALDGRLVEDLAEALRSEAQAEQGATTSAGAGA